jgi:hypothetical protein
MIMRRTLLALGLVFAVMSVSAQDNPYIVKTKGVKKPVAQEVTTAGEARQPEEDSGPQDFIGKNFRYCSMCDWKDGMRFMVIPEKYDLLVNTFRDATNNKEVSSGLLRHHIMVYKGYEVTPIGRTHVNFVDEADGKAYYYELPNGTFSDYCYGKMGVPTLAYLGDVDRARELLMDKVLLTRAQLYRVDTDYDSDGYKEVTVEKNKVVTVKAIGVGTRSFPVKIIVEDEDGKQFFQCVAMSKTNSGLRDDEFIMDNEKFLFRGSFEYTDDKMAVSSNVQDYLNQTIHTNHATLMRSKGSGKVRDVKVPRFTGFIIDEINPVKNSKYYTLTLRETESRRVYQKDVAFSEDDIISERDGKPEDFFGYLFGMGEGAAKSTSLETRAAIREGRVIPGMTTEEVEMAVGEPFNKVTEDDNEKWMYARSNNVILDVWFNDQGRVTRAKARKAGTPSELPDNNKKGKDKRKQQSSQDADGPFGGTMSTGTPLTE